MASHYSSVSIRDFSGESSATTVYNGAITTASIAGFLTDFGAWKTALQNIILGVIAKDKWVGDATNISNAIPTDKNAQRERKLMLHYETNTIKKLLHITIPTVDVAKLTMLPGGKDIVDITTGTEMLALVAAFNTLAKNPDNDAEGCTVVGAELVGRSL